MQVPLHSRRPTRVAFVPSSFVLDELIPDARDGHVQALRNESAEKAPTWRRSVALHRLHRALTFHVLTLITLACAVSLGFVNEHILKWMAASLCIAYVLGHILIQGGHRWIRHDSSLATPRLLLSIAMLALVYVQAGPVRHEILLLVLPLQLMACVANGRLPGLRGRVLKAWLLSKDPTQQVIIFRYLIGALNCVAGVVALNWGVTIGMVTHATATQWLTGAATVCLSGFYIVLRSGLNKRLADPSMTEPQILVAITFLAAGYAVGGPGRGLALMLTVVILMFGMFAIKPRQVRRASAVAAVMFGGAMIAVAAMAPQSRALETQIIHFFVMAIMLTSVSVLTGELAKLRSRLSARKNELGEALERIQLIATKDDLTGLCNRRHMQALLNAEKHRHERAGADFCVCMIDIDHFKSINDRYGHGVGDEVLSRFAAAVSTGLRDNDVVARWGGEEFLFMFPNTHIAMASRCIDRARKALGTVMLSPSEPAVSATFSAGLAEYRLGEPIEDTVARADRAMYKAKADGRDRTQWQENAPGKEHSSSRK